MLRITEKKKKIWYLDVNYEIDDDFTLHLIEWGYTGIYTTRKEGEQALKDFVRELKENFKDEIEEEKADNTISIALYVGEVYEDFDEEMDNFYEASSDNYHAVVERYLCGRW